MNTVKALHIGLTELADNYDNFRGWEEGFNIETHGYAKFDEERTTRIYDLMVDVDNLVTEWRNLTDG